jgi:hypothetical protein
MTDIARTKPVLDDTEAAEEPAGRERVTKETAPPVIAPGWSRNIRPRQTAYVKYDRFDIKVDAEEVIIKFLDETPFAPVLQHWLTTEKGDRPFTCFYPEVCPGCSRGHTSKATDYFNVVQLNDNIVDSKPVDGPMLRVWQATADPSEAIEEMAKGKRTSPINKPGLYFTVRKTKAATGFNTFKLERSDEENLMEDWGIQPLTSEQLAKFNKEKFDSSIVKVNDAAEVTAACIKFLDD